MYVVAVWFMTVKKGSVRLSFFRKNKMLTDKMSRRTCCEARVRVHMVTSIFGNDESEYKV